MFSEVLASCILLFVSISFVHCTLYEPQNKVKDEVCKSNKCSKRGNDYFNNLNPAVNPCDDFYSFVCGVWHMHHKAPAYMPHWTTQHVMETRVIEDLKGILDTPSISPDRELLQLKHFYDICMKRPFLGRLNPKEVGKHILTVGRFGQKKLWDIHQKYLKLTSESAFFNYYIHGYPSRDFTPLLLLSEVNSAYGAIFHDDWKVEEKKNYSQFLYFLMTSLGLPDSESVIKEKIKAVIAFREQLNKISAESRNEAFLTLEAKTARDFDKWFRQKNSKVPKPKNPPMPWETIIKSILSVTPKKYHDMPVTAMRNDDFFILLEPLLSSTSEEVLVAHMEIFFAETHTVLTSHWEDLLEKTVIEPSTLLRSIRLDVPRYISCIADNNMWPQVGNVLQRKWFQKDIVPRIQQLITGLQMAMTSQIKESTWLNPFIQRKTTQKILDIKTWIGYPPWYSDLTKPNNPRLNSEENDPLRADAHIDLDAFVMYIKSPLLKSPVYDPDIPNVYNLAGIGYFVGHELYHVVEDCGLYYTAGGRPVQWWPTEMRERCMKQRTCFADAYNKETKRVFQLTYREKIKGANEKSFHEDIPDVMGLDAAFRLFQVLKNKDKKNCQTLPRFEKYTCEQMFFIAFGNTMCGHISSKLARQQVETAQHSLDSVRVNGAVMHNKEFAKAFQCPKGKPMNPEVKCSLWT